MAYVCNNIIIAEIKQKKTYRLRIPTSNETVGLNSFVVFRSTVSTHDTVNNVQCTLLFYPMILFVGYLGCPFFAGFSLLCSIFFTRLCWWFWFMHTRLWSCWNKIILTLTLMNLSLCLWVPLLRGRVFRNNFFNDRGVKTFTRRCSWTFVPSMILVWLELSDCYWRGRLHISSRSA